MRSTLGGAVGPLQLLTQTDLKQSFGSAGVSLIMIVKQFQLIDMQLLLDRSW